jgi:hypothetical protein
MDQLRRPAAHQVLETRSFGGLAEMAASRISGRQSPHRRSRALWSASCRGRPRALGERDRPWADEPWRVDDAGYAASGLRGAGEPGGSSRGEARPRVVSRLRGRVMPTPERTRTRTLCVYTAYTNAKSLSTSNLTGGAKLLYCNGWGGIRTHGTLSRTHTFQACALNHSATHPKVLQRNDLHSLLQSLGPRRMHLSEHVHLASLGSPPPRTT